MTQLKAQAAATAAELEARSKESVPYDYHENMMKLEVWPTTRRTSM